MTRLLSFIVDRSVVFLCLLSRLFINVITCEERNGEKDERPKEGAEGEGEYIRINAPHVAPSGREHGS